MDNWKPTPLAELEKQHILRMLEYTEGNKIKAAKLLCIDPKTLHNKLKKYGYRVSVRVLEAPPDYNAPAYEKEPESDGLI